MNRVLIVAYHFPPIRHSSGVHRTLNFVRHLRDHGWESLVLTVHPRAYPEVGADLLNEIPETTVVERAFALDAARHLSLAGRFPKFAANPDRWASWLPFALHAGRRLIGDNAPSAILSTYPIATAHLVGERLAAWSGLPWIADFRDSMYDDGYPTDPRQRAIHVRIDRAVAQGCTRALVTTPATRRLYRSRYPALPDRHWQLIPNGYSEHDFAALGPQAGGDAGDSGRRVLLHSGILYPVERDPVPFFKALRALKRMGVLDASRLQVRLRATAHDEIYAPILRDMDLDDLVELAPALPYREALAEMTHVDGLLLLQAAGCNHQVPAKLYEYLRAQRPIIALTDAGGDTAQILREAGADNLLPLDSQARIEAGLPAMLDALDQGRLRVAPRALVDRYSREHGAARLAEILQEITTPG